jgi:hypothetical protein
MQCTPTAILGNLFNRAPSSKTRSKEALRRLLAAVEGTERGLKTSPQQLQEIKACFLELEEAGQPPATDALLNATWRLLWTTEKVSRRRRRPAAPLSPTAQHSPSYNYCTSHITLTSLMHVQETLFILKNAGLFGTKAGEVYQVIDAKAGSLTNVIEFPPSGAFIVDSDIQLDNCRRAEFQFTGARLQTAKSTYTLPPLGQGWFNTTFVDGQYRLSKDVRGDFLLIVKDGPPRKF